MHSLGQNFTSDDIDEMIKEADRNCNLIFNIESITVKFYYLFI